jgi:hypothetical protein
VQVNSSPQKKEKGRKKKKGESCDKTQTQLNRYLDEETPNYTAFHTKSHAYSQEKTIISVSAAFLHISSM